MIDKAEPVLLGTYIMLNQFVDIYLINLNINASQLSLQTEEVINEKWVTIVELNMMRGRMEIVNSVIMRFDSVKDKIPFKYL